MTEEDKTKTVPESDNPPKPEQKKEEKSSTKPKEPEFDLDALRKEIDQASNSIVSEDVRKLIEAEREEARKQAMKEAENSQYLKEKEAEIAQLKKEQEEKERKSAEQLDALKKKIDELASSKQVVNNDNPFKSAPTPTKKQPFDLDDKDLDIVERESFYALLNRRLE